MNYYETIIIFDIKKYEDSANDIQKICQEYTGKTYKVNREDIGIKNLAYEIKKRKKGYYILFHWMGTQEQCVRLDNYMCKDDNVLKFVTIKMDGALDLEPYEQEQEQQPVDLLDIIYNL